MTLKELMPKIRKGAPFGLVGISYVYRRSSRLIAYPGPDQYITVDDLLANTWEDRTVKINMVVRWSGNMLCVTRRANIILGKDSVGSGSINFFNDHVDYLIVDNDVEDWLLKNPIRDRKAMEEFRNLQKRMNK